MKGGQNCTYIRCSDESTTAGQIQRFSRSKNSPTKTLEMPAMAMTTFWEMEAPVETFCINRFIVDWGDESHWNLVFTLALEDVYCLLTDKTFNISKLTYFGKTRSLKHFVSVELPLGKRGNQHLKRGKWWEAMKRCCCCKSKTINTLSPTHKHD